MVGTRQPKVVTMMPNMALLLRGGNLQPLKWDYPSDPESGEAGSLIKGLLLEVV